MENFGDFSIAVVAAGMRWECKSFADLTGTELYAALQLRNEVFVVEQNCVYQDCDGYDLRCRHLLGWGEGAEGPYLGAYLRLVPPGLKYAEASIGRVVTSPRARGTGAGRQLVGEALALLDRAGEPAVRISAQAYLEKFYRGFGFEAVSEPYLEDGIPHVEMLRAGRRPQVTAEGT